MAEQARLLAEAVLNEAVESGDTPLQRSSAEIFALAALLGEFDNFRQS